MQCALYLSALILQSWTLDLIYLHDGSPLFGEEVIAPHGKRLTQFLGIPFAEPPIGNLRFRKPKPKHPWRTPLNATVWPNSCIQSFDTYFGEFYGSTMWNANTPTSEDCLYMNIFVPGKIDPTKRLAVMVWVYGGGFWSGTSTLDVYDGRILPVEENIILVSMNYRVSMLGFLYLGRPEAPGNMGLWDQQLALKWVHKNIDVFGGDPSRIVLFGESAGAASVNMHMLSARSTPYFQRAIIQSGAATAPWSIEPRDVALARTIVLYNAMKCGNMSLQNPDYDKILYCFLRADADLIRENEWAPVREFADFPWVPVVDGDFLVESAQTSLRQGNFKHTQLLAGSNRDESIYFIVYQLPHIFPVQDFFTKKDFVPDRHTWLKAISDLLPRQMIKSQLALAAILHEYEPANLPVRAHDWMDSMEKMLGDYHFTCNVNEMALAHTKHGGDTYYYYFTHRATAQTWPEWMGVLHGYEINFIFGEPFNKKFNYTAEEQELSSRFMRYWANFARTGDPNKNEDGTYTPDVWPKYNAQSMEYMNLTVESAYPNSRRTGHGPRRKHCAFWKAYLPNLMAAVAEVGDPFLLWKQQMDKWQNEYITDWQYHFEQYKKYQTYRHSDDSCGAP
ncbi:hypothetical protein Y032_0021g361 [Ancylostoma ceylanicum]|uniref:Carboxylic ester hydrolase n=1 Tax=Ancylostoma ceylanicum TaxID=53326 RepID=A0A016UZS7_9BILA|nr:hypothetical protein Y032_0021g361 [Ancylostoma ceylanicum]